MGKLLAAYDYGNINPATDIWPLWWDELISRGLRHTRTYNWDTEYRPNGLLPDGWTLIASSVADYTSGYMYLSPKKVLVYMWWQNKEITIFVAAANERDLLDIEPFFRELYPETKIVAGDEIRLRFWFMGPNGSGAAYNRLLAVPKWEEIVYNYGLPVQEEMNRLLSDFRPSHGGQLLLWQGNPGTGKTFAIRALIKGWLKWCDAHYVVDPEAFFNNPAYMMQVLLDGNRNYDPEEFAIDDTEQPEEMETKERWKLIILEDSGELLASDAKMRTGQALSRLLNVADGLIGQGLRVLILITTNEEIATLHEAVSRPGRCASKMVFSLLSVEEATAWLASHNVLTDIEDDTSLAELYGMVEGFAKAPEVHKKSMGFRPTEIKPRRNTKATMGFNILKEENDGDN